MVAASEAVSLIHSLKQQVHHTSKSQEELNQIELLLDNLAIYSKRVNGLPLTEHDYKIPAHRNFAGLVAVPKQRIYDSLVRRLRVILRFNITSSEKVTRDLLYGLVSKEVEPLSGRQIKLLSSLYLDPNISPKILARNLNVSIPTIRKETNTLREKVGLRFTYITDWRRFKLRHFGVFFIARDVEASRKLESIFKNNMGTYRTTTVFDTTYLRGFAGFRIPDQVRPIRLFREQLRVLEEEYMSLVQIHDVTENYLSICFDHFDYDSGTWMIESDVSTIGLLKFVRDNWGVLPKPRGMRYTEEGPFDQLDYYLATFLVGDGQSRMKSIQNRLAAYGIEAPRTTVSTRKTRMLKEGSLLPCILFFSPNLPFFLTFAFTCDRSVAKEISVAVAQMPISFASISDIGCVVNVYAPVRSVGPILNLLSLTREDPRVENVWQMQQYTNLGSVDPANIGHKWNGSYWEWDESEFQLPY